MGDTWEGLEEKTDRFLYGSLRENPAGFTA